MSVTGKIFISRSSLNLKLMLEGGQCFRWSKTEDNQWIGVAAKVLWLLTQQDDHLEFAARSSEKIDSSYCRKFLNKYLRLDEDLEALYAKWSRADEHFAKVAVRSTGLRILHQEPIENLFSFICSSNNNIIRISSMVDKMCKLYGEKVAEENGVHHYSFPELERLAGKGVEESLRSAGFGYRAKYIHKSAVRLLELGGEKWLSELARLSYDEAKSSLLQLEGVGPKVADCICLMSLGHLCAVPVDTHVFQIAAQHYLPQLKTAKSCTPKIYRQICDHFIELYGPYAGWAHCILFCADLKMFKEETGSVRKKPSKSSKTCIEGKHSNDELSKTGKETKLLSERAIIVESETDVRTRNGRRRQVSEMNGSDEKTVKKVKLNNHGRSRSEIKCSGSIPVKREELNLLITLNSGQTYRWIRVAEDIWKGVFAHKLWTLHQYDDKIDFEAKWSSEDRSRKDNAAVCENEIRSYFRLDFPLQSYYAKWSAADAHFAKIAQDFYGLRMIRQDPVENTFAFICSSNTIISRTRNMVEFLCTEYGEEICIEGTTRFYDFPKIDSLILDETLETKLVTANFGFRAKYVAGSVAYISKQGGMAWFERLVSADYTEATSMLLELPGIGRKVADCICLTALDHLNTIPVDTHVYQVASRHYLPHLSKNKTVTKKSYDEIVEKLTTRFGPYCGWAHTVLFCSDLRYHSDLHSEGNPSDTVSQKSRLYLPWGGGQVLETPPLIVLSCESRGVMNKNHQAEAMTTYQVHKKYLGYCVTWTHGEL